MPQQPDQSHPAPPQQAPDPAHNYERAKPERESAHGNLDQKSAAPQAHADKVGPESTSGHTNRPNSDSMENSEDDEPAAKADSTSVQPSVRPGEVTRSMKDEEPDGWDLAPNDISDPQQRRHSRIEGKGGVP